MVVSIAKTTSRNRRHLNKDHLTKSMTSDGKETSCLKQFKKDELEKVKN